MQCTSVGDSHLAADAMNDVDANSSQSRYII